MFARLALILIFFLLIVARTCALDNVQNKSVQIEKVAESVILGEGPHWDIKSQKLYYVDGDGQKILRYDPATGSRTYASTNGLVGVAIPVNGTNNKLIAGVGRNVVLVTWDGESNDDNPPIEVLTSVDTDRTDTRFNDGKCDPAGRFWAGTMATVVDGYYIEPNRGALYLTDNSGNANKKVSPVSISNGLSWSLDNKVMYYIDSPTRQIWAYDYDNADGSISNKRVLFDLNVNNVEGIPDGMTNDENGNLWVAVYNGTAVIQVDPVTGQLLRKIEMPVQRITSVAFGGPQLDVLYVTSARDNISADSGALFRVTGLGVKGRAPTDFKHLPKQN